MSGDGRDRREAPGPRPAPNRADIARLSSAVGALALALAVTGWLLAGDVTPVVFGAALIAILGLGVWIALAPDDFRALITGRRAAHGSNSLLVSVLVAGIMAVIYSISVTAGIAVDLTSTGYYSLKPDVRPILQNLAHPIQITAFYNRLVLGERSADAPILRMFVDANPAMVRLVYIDPDEQPLVARQFGLNTAYGLFVSYLQTDGTPDLRTTGTVQVRGDTPNERLIAEAILQLQALGQFRVVFTVGSGEISIEDEATGIRDGLRNVGISVDVVDITQNDIPPDTTALVILGPRRDFSREAVSRIERYMAGGGKVLLMAEPAYEGSITFMVPEDSPMVDYLEDTWGIRPHRDIVFDPIAYYISQYYVQPAQYAAGHPIIVKDQSGTPSRPLFMITQSWDVGSVPNVTATVLYATTDQAFGKLDLREVAADPDRASRAAGDLAGPLTLVAAAENTINGARLIVVGDADWIRNDVIQSFDGQYLWTNMIDWLTQFIERITVNPIAVQLPLNVSSAELNIASLITLAIVPGLLLVAGGIVWWRRVRR
jgi:ABC-type uncharacterized transport system involved in gliding motility auxiliary subunit